MEIIHNPVIIQSFSSCHDRRLGPSIKPRYKTHFICFGKFYSLKVNLELDHVSFYMPLILNNRWLHRSLIPSNLDIGADVLIETEDVKKKAAVSLVYFSFSLRLAIF